MRHYKRREKERKKKIENTFLFRSLVCVYINKQLAVNNAKRQRKRTSDSILLAIRIR